MFNLEIPFDPGYTLAVSVRRATDRAYFDAAGQTFVPTEPASRLIPLAEAAGLNAGLYRLNYGPTPGGQWWNGKFLVTLHVLAAPGYALPADPATPRIPSPRAHVTFEVEFANGGSTYQPPPYYTY